MKDKEFQEKLKRLNDRAAFFEALSHVVIGLLFVTIIIGLVICL